MLDLTEAPPEILRLMDWLETEGFAPRAEFVRDHFDQLAKFWAGERPVELMTDRGEWEIRLGSSEMVSSFPPDMWEAWLRRSDLAGDPETLEHQVDFVMGDWSRALALARDTRDAEAQIRALGDDWVRRTFGEFGG
jgi:hypothetical protein